MTLESQRIAIAEACGWEVRRTASGEISPSWQGWRTDDEDEQSQPVPSYLSDLNAMHEAEKVLQDENLAHYYHKLYQECGAPDAVSATAAQRAEAFLRTLGLWTT